MNLTGLKNSTIINTLFLLSIAFYFIAGISSCGKQGNASPRGLNVQYHVLNLSPDLLPVNLFIDNKPVNKSPYIFGIDQGYFYLPSIDTPYQFRSTLSTGNTLLTTDSILKPGAKYTLFITGAVADKSLTSIFTVDTAATSALGRGKIRFVNASPSASGGLDIFANGTSLFSGIVYKKISPYMELPVGNYDLQLQATGTTSVLKDITPVIIQDGRLYTLYAYGYTTRVDSAAFNAAVITNR